MHRNNSDKGRISTGALIVLLFLITAPCVALCQLTPPLDLRWTAGYLLFISLVTYGCYASDKKKAQSDEWRTPEATLHLMELAGGWPAAFIAQRRLRHKISKKRFQAFFWMIILIYQFAALDFLSGWTITRGALRVIREQTGWQDIHPRSRSLAV
jgi:uncharacterized membrane protein YsdA (DUF1294 family)